MSGLMYRYWAVIYMDSVVTMLHDWPREDCFIKELGNRVIKINTTSKILSPASLLEGEHFVLLH